MTPDDNWKETRVLAEDLSELLGIPKQASEDFLLVLENLIIHKLVEKLSDEDCKGQDISIELPYLGTLIISVDEQGRVSEDFVCRKTFARKVKSAVNQRESPLVSQLGKILGESLVKKMEEGEVEDNGLARAPCIKTK